jgi:hypothetical protein
MDPRAVDAEFAALECQWREAQKAARIAHLDLDACGADGAVRMEAQLRLERAEGAKARIMREIEALEEKLLDD